jgi:prolyl aminopeptidase
MVISYDQLGCGNSFVEGHPELWNIETWIGELKALRRHLNLNRVHILGQSWGGMMLIAYLIDHCPEGIQSAILSSTLSSSTLWSREQHRLISFMPEKEQAAIAEAERTGNWESPEYLAANDHYTVLHACDSDGERPECLTRKKRFGTESYLTAWGPNEYTPLGNLRNFDYTARLHEINTPCLIINGTNDECTPLLAKTMFDRIPHVRWELMEGARHMTFVDQPEQYCKLLSEWMTQND